MKISAFADRYIYVTTFSVSIIFSLLATATEPLINHDGIWYISAAKAYLYEGFGAAVEVFYWPFYSILIAGVHQLVGLSLEHAAHLINAILAALSCVLFVKLYEDVSETSSSRSIAALVILAFLGINKYRPDIMRDFGYWCFFIAQTIILLRYYKSPGWRTALIWQCLAVAATLFRIEGVVLIVLFPLVVLMKDVPFVARVKLLLPLYSLTLLGMLVFLVSIGSSSALLARVQPYIDLITLSVFVEQFSSHVAVIGEVFYYDGWNLGKYFGTLSVVFVVAMVAYVLLKMLGCLGWLYSVLILLGLKRYGVTSLANHPFVIFLLGVLSVFVIVYTIQKPVLTPRYTTSISFLLLLFLVHYSSFYLKSERLDPKFRKVVWGVGFLVFFSTADALISKPSNSKDYFKEAGAWIHANAAQNVGFVSNEKKIIYFAERFRIAHHLIGTSTSEVEEEGGVLLSEALETLRQNNEVASIYVALDIKRSDDMEGVTFLDLLSNYGKTRVVSSFENEKRDKVLIFETVFAPNRFE